MRNAANSMVKSASQGVSVKAEEVQSRLRVSMALWELLTVMPFPIHLLDDENRKLVNPIVDASGGNPASGGYAEGGGVITTPHTGGTQLDGVQKDGAYVTPEHKLNPGVMYSEGNSAKEATVDSSHLNEMRKNGVKFSAEKVIATTQAPDGKVIFLEVGNSKAGLQHVVERHAGEFESIGVAENQIPKILMQAVTEGKVVGYQGKDAGRAIYETVINGQRQKIAITVSDNGFIVGANPAGRVK
ncbi:hypothetical protein PBOI14_49430 [Pseudomonas sp. Boi14]|nr:hypothetical protein PBOI14_49430 [Pseudomonas sp. Boi14]